MTRLRAICPHLRGMSSAKLSGFMRSFSVMSQNGGGGGALLSRAKQCPYMSQCIAESDRSDMAAPSDVKVGGASGSEKMSPHSLPKPLLERTGGVCPVSQKRMYATQSLSLIHI